MTEKKTAKKLQAHEVALAKGQLISKANFKVFI